MGGGLIQLVAYGSQDIYLTGNPQITFFKLVYRRHTNFSMESIKQTIDGSNTITSSGGGNGSVTIDRNGDLLSKIYVVTKGANINNGSNIIREVKLEIGGQTIDTHSKNWMMDWRELSIPGDKHVCLKRMMGDNSNRGYYIHENRETYKTIITSQIPLQFWFCRNPGLALPLIALQYHEIVLHFTWGGGTELSGNDIFRHIAGTGSSNQTATCELWCDYIYLDTDERRRFAQTSHEYLIEQVQSMSVKSGTTSSVNGSQLKIDLNLNHPVKELIWDYNGILFSDITLELNGHERFAKQQEEYFTLRQPFEHHSHVPHNNLLLDELYRDETHTTDSTTEILYDASTASAVSNNGGVSGTSRFQFRAWGALNDMSAITQVVDGSLAMGNTTFALFLNNELPVVHEIERNSVLLFTEVVDGGFGPRSFILTVREKYVNPSQTVNSYNQNASGANVVVFSVTSSEITDGATGDMLSNYGNFIIPQNNKAYTMTFMGHQVQTTTHIRIHDGENLGKRIGVYSFALKPEEHQPSGTCNFSRIDTAKLIGNYNPMDTTSGDTINIYAVNYNVLRIMSGMGGLAYSN